MDGPLDQEENEQIREMIGNNPAAAVAKIREYLEPIDHIRLNVAITGEPGTGKSTFVNAFRGIDNNHERAAPTGCKSTTKPTSYHHPDYPNVILWDLPGIGSTVWPADKYVERVKLEKFDFFIIISANRFTENDVKLAMKIQKMGKKFYFVRSKIIHNLRDEEQSQRDFREEKTLETIMEDCIKGLKELGTESPQVFLLSIPDLSLGDLNPLKTTFKEELPELKRHALCLAMSNLYLQVLSNKEENLRVKITYYSFLSAAGAALPVPLLSAVVDLVLIYLAFRRCLVAFRLEGLSLEKLAAVTRVPCDDTRIISTTSDKKDLIKYVIFKVLTHVANTATVIASRKGYSFISVFRITVASALFFTTTYAALNFSVAELAKTAHRVFKRALRLTIV